MVDYREHVLMMFDGDLKLSPPSQSHASEPGQNQCHQLSPAEKDLEFESSWTISQKHHCLMWRRLSSCGDEDDEDDVKNLRHHGKEHKGKAERQEESRMTKDKEQRQVMFQMKRDEAT